MKKISKVLLALMAASFVLFGTGCSNDSSDSSESGVVVPTLPASVGENVFSGKTISDGNTKYVATDSTYDVYNKVSSSWEKEKTYKYTYNADTKILSCRLEKMYNGNMEATAGNLYSVINSMASAYSDVILEQNKEYLLKMFSVVNEYEVTISGTEVSIKQHFTGDVTKNFHVSSSMFSGDMTSLGSQGENSYDSHIVFTPNFNTTDKTFSANFYISENEDAVKLGTAKGTYEVGESSVTLTFTSVPEHSFTDKDLQIKENVPYELKVVTKPSTFIIEE